MLEQIKQESFPKEAYLVSLFWNNPHLYATYTKERLDGKTYFQNKQWGNYFNLGRQMFDSGIRTFDDISVEIFVESKSYSKNFEKLGGYQTIEEWMDETKDKSDNFLSYLIEVKRYAQLVHLYNMFGDKVFEVNGKYDYRNMDIEEIRKYWSYKFENVMSIGHIATSSTSYILDEARDIFNDLLENPDIGMPYYKSHHLSDAVMGMAMGNLYIMGMLSGQGKSSFTVNKIVMSAIKNKEKLCIIANEMDKKAYIKMLFSTIMGAELYERFRDIFGEGNIGFNRKAYNRGRFTDDELAKIEETLLWIDESIVDSKKIIKFEALEINDMDMIESIIRKSNAEGYNHFIIDTAKPSENGRFRERWEQFVNDFDRLYKLCRSEAGGLNIHITAMVQIVDTAIKERWLTYEHIADGKKIKNVADFVAMFRRAWDDEYDGESKEVTVRYRIPPEKSLNGEWENAEMTLEKGKVYYFLFIPKNRRGQVSEADGVIVYEVDFNYNKWKEVGKAYNVQKGF